MKWGHRVAMLWAGRKERMHRGRKAWDVRRCGSWKSGERMRGWRGRGNEHLSTAIHRVLDQKC